ncbi:MAG: rubrerythrin family protein [Deltaproteobacteria bacterium]
MSKTYENLRQAFAGESQAYFRYLGFAEKADQEGFQGTARLFRAAARSEMVHALSHQKAMGSTRDTMTNLKEAIEGETHESKTMYPVMVKDAVEEKESEARHSFEYAMAIEIVHAQLFKKASENPRVNQDAIYYVCPVCGYTVMNKPPKKCPYCGVDEKKFVEVN